MGIETKGPHAGIARIEYTHLIAVYLLIDAATVA
jgi:hypothetical protein